MDAYRQGHRFVVQFDLPGVDPASVELTLEKNVLAVRAERHSAEPEGQEWLVSERPHGPLSRQLFLGEGLDTDRIEASYDRGVLNVTVPVAETAKPRKVKITAGDGARASKRRPAPPERVSSAGRPIATGIAPLPWLQKNEMTRGGTDDVRTCPTRNDGGGPKGPLR